MALKKVLAGVTAFLIMAAPVTMNKTANSLIMPEITANALDIIQSDGYKFDKSTGTITKYSGSETEVKIPSEIDGVTVTGIGAEAFMSCQKIKSIVIPDTVKIIGEYAFHGCLSLSGITLGKSVESIGERAFNNCKGLTSIVIPDSVTSIGDECFYECGRLQTIEAPCHLFKTTKNWAIYSSAKLKSRHSENCGCDDFVFDDSVGMITGYKGNDTDVAIPFVINGTLVKKIGDSAFAGCDTVETVTIPETVKSLGSNIFENCPSLTDVYIPEAFVNESDWRNGCNANCHFGNSAIIYKNFLFDTATQTIVEYKGKEADVTVPQTIGGITVSKIGDGAFGSVYNRTCIKSVTLPDTVISIGDEAFADCSNLESITLSNTLETIGDAAFADCRSLKNITFPDTLKSIGGSAFYACHFQDIIIPDSVKSIDILAFSGCSAKTLTISSFTEIGDNAFRNAEFDVLNFKGTEAEWSNISKRSMSTIKFQKLNIIDETIPTTTTTTKATTTTTKASTTTTKATTTTTKASTTTTKATTTTTKATTTTTKTSTTTIKKPAPTNAVTTTTTATLKATLYGDANCDKTVDITDVVLLKSWILNSEKYEISKQGLANADVQECGNGVNSNDIVAVQQYSLKLIDKLPVD